MNRVALLLTLFSCFAATASAQTAGDLMQLEPGNEWTYEERGALGGGATLELRVTSRVAEWRQVEGVLGNRWLWIGSRGAGVWTWAPGVGTKLLLDTHRGTTASVSTPVGPFQGILVDPRRSRVAVDRMILADGVGLVSFRRQGKTWDLVRAHVNGQDLTRFQDDHGNDPVGATALGLGQPIQGSIESTGDRDWFAVQVVAGGSYRFHTGNLGPTMDSVLGLYAADGTTLLAENDDGQNMSLASELRHRASSSGVLYLEVRHFYPNSPGGSYTLTVTLDAPPAPPPAPPPPPPASSAGLHWARVDSRELQWFTHQTVTTPDGGLVRVGELDQPTVVGRGEPNEVTLRPSGDTDAFVARYRPDGSLAWAKRMGGVANSRTRAQGVAIGPGGKLFVAGAFDTNLVLGQGEPHETRLASRGNTDIFVARLDSTGRLEWGVRRGDQRYNGPVKIDALPRGGCVIVADSQATKLGSGGGELWSTPVHSVGEVRAFPTGQVLLWGSRKVTRLEADGRALWASHSFPATLRDMVLLPDGGYVVVGHSFGVAFVRRVRPTGGYAAWTDLPTGAEPESVALHDGRLWVAGRFKTLATFAPGQPQETRLQSTAGHGLFLARYELDGRLHGVERLGGSDQEATVEVHPGPRGVVSLVGLLTARGLLTLGSGVRAQQIDNDPARYSLEWRAQWSGPGASNGGAVVTPAGLTLQSMSPSSGQAGTIVTLRGVRFGSTVHVTFNGVPATIQSANADANGLVTVVCTAPPAASGPVQVSSDGQTASAGVFSYR